MKKNQFKVKLAVNVLHLTYIYTLRNGCRFYSTIQQNSTVWYHTMSLHHSAVVNIALWVIFLHAVTSADQNLSCCSIVVILLPPAVIKRLVHCIFPRQRRRRHVRSSDPIKSTGHIMLVCWLCSHQKKPSAIRILTVMFKFRLHCMLLLLRLNMAWHNTFNMKYSRVWCSLAITTTSWVGA